MQTTAHLNFEVCRFCLRVLSANADFNESSLSLAHFVSFGVRCDDVLFVSMRNTFAFHANMPCMNYGPASRAL